MNSTTSKNPIILPTTTHDDNTKNPIILPTTTHDDNTKNPIILPTTTDDDNNVCDVDGDPLKTGVNYIIHDQRIRSYLVYWGNIGNTACPNTVLEYNSAEGNVGNVTAVQFFHLDTKRGEDVTVGSNINIMFSVKSSDKCAKQAFWKVDEKNYVVTDGNLGNKSNVFKIQKYGSGIQGYENVYKLTYCPAQDSCEDVSTVEDNGNIHLSTSGKDANPFFFAKA